MKLSWIALVGVLAFGCGHKGSGPTSPEAAPAFPAARWVPASPSYVFAAPTFADAQRGVRDAIDGLGITFGVSASEVGRELSRILAVDPFDASAVTAIGVDLEGGVVVFSEDLAPTFVVRVSAPEQMQGFLDKQRERGMVSRSVIVDGVEVYTAEVIRNQLELSWALADGWMWIHFTPVFARNEGTAWFSNSRKPASADWGRDWAWAQGAAGSGKGLVGFVDPKDVLGRIAARVPAALACVRLLDPVQRVAVAVEATVGGGGTTARGKLAIDLGPAAAQVTSATLPVPEGFAAAAANAPIVAQWNLDLVTLRAWAQPCLAVMNEDLRMLDRFGVRAGRAIVQRVNLDDKSGAGVVSLDLVHKRFFAGMLDDIPLRSTLERDRSFGPIAGHTIAVPFVATVDYILNDKVGYIAMGDGLLAKVIGSGTGVPGPIAALDVLPPGLSVETWNGLVEIAELPSSLVKNLLLWRDAHISIAIEGSSLVLAASGTRR